MPAKTQIRQIFYDAATREQLDSGFIPLDNSANERPDWYEFWVIKNYLERNALESDTWYGFLSPKFQDKTGMDSNVLLSFLDACETSGHDVFMAPAHWHDNVMFQNPYLQAEVGGHTGIVPLAQRFFDHAGLSIDIESSVAHSENFTFCNYVIAKPAYWRAWLRLAQIFFDVTEHDSSPLGADLRNNTSYMVTRSAPIKTFIQERFPYIIVQQEKMKSRSPGPGLIPALIAQRGAIDINTLSLLDSCNLMKIFYSQTDCQDYLQAFQVLSREAFGRWHSINNNKEAPQ
ncbi:MAG: hypothetical protein KDE31_23545 [Caldilineaceae bacterium]|nr:hypothetical protein [Caldilineaceae bacterium]